jgi:hypothetical protein
LQYSDISLEKLLPRTKENYCKLLILYNPSNTTWIILRRSKNADKDSLNFIFLVFKRNDSSSTHGRKISLPFLFYEMLLKNILQVSEIGRFTRALENLSRQCNYSIDIFANRRWLSYALMLCEDIIQWLDVEIFNSAIAMTAIIFSIFSQKFYFKSFWTKVFHFILFILSKFCGHGSYSSHTNGSYRER